jgi:hypothetical protein
MYYNLLLVLQSCFLINLIFLHRSFEFLKICNVSLGKPYSHFAKATHMPMDLNFLENRRTLLLIPEGSLSFNMSFNIKI